METVNPYRERARHAKAEKLARSAATLGFTAALAADMNDSAWISLANLADVRPPSGETRDLTVQLLREHTADDSRSAERRTKQGQPHRHPIVSDRRRRLDRRSEPGRAGRAEPIGADA